MARAKIAVDGSGNFYGVRINCPGCREAHTLPVRNPPAGYMLSPLVANRDSWTWNGSLDLPTFSPSLHIKTGHFATHHKPGDECWCTYNAEHPGESAPWECAVCHTFIRDGRIEFLSDCTHDLKSRTVDLPEIDQSDD